MNRKYLPLASIVLIATITMVGVLLIGHDRAGSSSSDPPSTSNAVSTDPEISRIATDLARVVLLRTGVTPEGVSVVVSDRTSVDELLDRTVDRDPTGPTYLFQFTGDFVDDSMRHPAGVDVSRKGRAIVVVVDAATGSSTEYGFLPIPVDLASIGEPMWVPVDPGSITVPVSVPVQSDR